MAAPTPPTLTIIATEGLKKAGYASPTAALIARAGDEWVEEVKNDIWRESTHGKLKSLQTSVAVIPTNGQAVHSFPSDFSAVISMILLDGNNTGTAQAGDTATITLASTETFTDDDLLGKEILIYAGTGKASIDHVITYVPATKVATVAANWATQPDSGSSYMILDSYKRLQGEPIWNYERDYSTVERGIPNRFYTIGDEDSSEYILVPIPYRSNDIPWGVRIRYYADLLTLDLASTLMGTLYKRWRTTLIQGVLYKALEDKDDSRASREKAIYESMLVELVGIEAYGTDIHSLQMRVER